MASGETLQINVPVALKEISKRLQACQREPINQLGGFEDNSKVMPRKLILAIILLVFWPLGLFYVWKYSGWATSTKWTATVLVGGIVVAGVVSGSLNLRDQDQEGLSGLSPEQLLKMVEDLPDFTVLLGGTPTPSNKFSTTELRQALLTLEDLSAGWSITHQPNFSTPPGAIAFASVAFEGSKSSLTQEIYVLPAGEADLAMAAFSTLRSCYEAPEALGAYRICPTAFPKLGEETVATSWTWPDVPGVSYAVSVRRGDIIVSLSHTGPDSMDAEETKAFARRADEKLAALAVVLAGF